MPVVRQCYVFLFWCFLSLFFFCERAWQWYGWRGSMPGLPPCGDLCRLVPGAPLAFVDHHSRRATYVFVLRCQYCFWFDATLIVHRVMSMHVYTCCSAVLLCNMRIEQAPPSTHMLTGDRYGQLVTAIPAPSTAVCRAAFKHG